jgi:hypothetical protein
MKFVYGLAGLLTVLTLAGTAWLIIIRISIPMFRGRKKNREINK